MNILSFDIGGTKIAYSIVDENGHFIMPAKKFSTPQTAGEISSKIKEIIDASSFDGLAVATAGVVYDNRLLSKPLNLPEGFEAIDFSSLTEKPVFVENDANSAAWCEYKIGAAKGCDHAIVLAIGTGVGCGIICDNKLLKGKSGAAGECAFAISGKDFAQLARQYNTAVDCFALYDLALKGDEAAQKVYEIWQNRLSEALIQLNDLFDTQKIVLAGSLAEIADYKLLQEKINKRSFGEAPLITKSGGLNFPALVGAALLWYDAYVK